MPGLLLRRLQCSLVANASCFRLPVVRDGTRTVFGSGMHALPTLSVVSSRSDNNKDLRQSAMGFFMALIATVCATTTAHCGFTEGHRFTGKDQAPMEEVPIAADSIGVLELQAILIPLTTQWCNDGPQDSKARALAMHTNHPDKPPIPDDVTDSWLKHVIPRVQQYGLIFKHMVLVSEGPHGGLGKAPTNTKRNYDRAKHFNAAIVNVCYSVCGFFFVY